MTLNRLLTDHIRKATRDRASMRRVLSLMRARGRVDEKRRVLALLGVNISKEEEALLIQKSKQEYPFYRYGIKVEAQEWIDVVVVTLETTSVLQIMEQMRADLDSVKPT